MRKTFGVALLAAFFVSPVFVQTAWAQTAGQTLDAEQAAQDSAIQSNAQATATNAADIDLLETTSAALQALLSSLQAALDALTVRVDALEQAPQPLGPIADADQNADQILEPGGAVGITALAIDPNPADTVTYSLTADAGGLFSIDPQSGIVTADGLDAETSATHVISVRADSSGGDFQTADFTVTVLDDNSEFAVSAIQDTDAAANELQENQPAGSAVGITASADDQDVSDTVTYSLMADCGGQCQIDSQTGVITTTAPLDFEAGSSLALTVQALSSDGSSRTLPLTISVLDDLSDNSGPEIVDVDAAPNQVSETAANTNSTGYTAAVANLPTGVTVSNFDLLDWAGGRFRIQQNGDVVARRISGDEAVFVPGVYTITVEVTLSDGAVLTNDVEITITQEAAAVTIEDADGAANQVTEGAASGTPIGFTAQLSDSSTATWALLDEAGGRLQIDVSSGVVTTGAVATDFETATGHSFQVQATLPDSSTLDRVFMVNVLNDPSDDPPPVASNRGVNGDPANQIPGAPANPDLTITNCASLRSQFNAAGAGDVILIDVGDCYTFDQVTSGVLSLLEFRNNQEVYLTASTKIRGSRPLTNWTASNGDWFTAFDAPTGDDSCGCSADELNPDERTDPDLNPFIDGDNLLADDRLGVLFNGRHLIQVEGNPGPGEWARSGNEIRLGMNPNGNEVEQTYVNSLYRGSAQGVRLEGPGVIYGFATRMHRGTLDFSPSGEGWIVDGPKFIANTSNAIRSCNGLIRNVTLAFNGQAGLQVHSSGDSCQFPVEAAFVGPDENAWQYALVNAHCYGNNALHFKDSWAASACVKLGLGTDFGAFVRNICDGGPEGIDVGDGKCYWADNNNTGPVLVSDNLCFGEACATAEHLIVSGTPDGHPGNGYESTFLVTGNTFIADGNGGFQCNRALFSLRRNPFARFDDNDVVLTRRGSGACLKQTNTASFTPVTANSPANGGGLIGSATFGTVITNNRFYWLATIESGTNGAKFGAGWTSVGSGDYSSFGSTINNNAHFFPQGHDTELFYYTAPGGAEVAKTWAEYRAETGFDANSTIAFVADVEARVSQDIPEAAPYLALIGQTPINP